VSIENDTRLSVARRFFELDKAGRQATTFAQQIEVDLAQLERVKALLSAGLGKTNDVAQVERNLAEDRISLARREYTVRAARRALNLAIGRPADTTFELVPIEEPVDATSVPAKAELVKLAVEQRPELTRVRASLDISRKNVDIARADYFPIVALGASYSRASRKPGRVFDDPTQNYFASIGLTLQWNLFNGRATTANVQQAELELSKLEATYEEQERIVAGEVEERLEVLALSAEVYRLAQEAIRAGEEAVRLARGLYTEGRGTLLELRDAELRLTLQKLSAIEARIDLLIAREELRRAIGGDLSWEKRPG
jgi:outer membrane protein TolC